MSFSLDSLQRGPKRGQQARMFTDMHCEALTKASGELNPQLQFVHGTRILQSLSIGVHGPELNSLHPSQYVAARPSKQTAKDHKSKQARTCRPL